jgi:energy-coupling factor transporter ATP-binding protein EcfA2
MKRIEKIRIKQFKAFQEEECFNFRGKNILAYGNNGSGKSSLFWALYTFLQSSIKPNDDEVKKYFVNFDDRDVATHQTLKNIFATQEEIPHIEVVVKESNGNSKIYKVDTSNPPTRPENNGNDTSIQELNLASDFINYKLLQNFYTSTHKQEINLWPVFERDIFPFLTEGTKNYLDIIKERTNDIPRRSDGGARYGVARTNFESSIEELNQTIQSLLESISRIANDFMRKHFYENKDVLKVHLEFTRGFNYSTIKSGLWGEMDQVKRFGFLKIKLSVDVNKKSDSTEWEMLHRPHSFLNEAQLTRIAIGIRIGALRSRVQGTDFKILVLDDLLISLDMSNRLDMVRILLNTDSDPDLEKVFGGFQKIILTHDLGFYELVKRHTDPSEWEYFRFHSSDQVNEPPKVKKDKSRIEKAQAFLVDGEYDACGSELRKETEALLDKYLKGLKLASNGEFDPLMNKLNRALKEITEENRKAFNKASATRGLPREIIEKLKTDFENDTDLTTEQKGKLRSLRNDLTNYMVRHATLTANKERLINGLKDTLKRIMNPASHSSIDPLYEGELIKAIDGVKNLKQILERN